MSTLRAGAQKGSVPWNKGKKTGAYDRWKELFPNENIFVENSSYNRKSLKKRILSENLIKYKCEICKCNPTWQENQWC